MKHTSFAMLAALLLITSTVSADQCGSLNQRSCTTSERIIPCDDGLVPSGWRDDNRCITKKRANAGACGGLNQYACKRKMTGHLTCKMGLVLSKARCVKLPDSCGGWGQFPCNRPDKRNKCDTGLDVVLSTGRCGK